MPRDSDTNLWTASTRESFEALVIDRDVEADLVVIGGGFTGCSAALEAARRGASVVLLEGNTIAHGGSGRNVGLVNAGLWLPPDKLVSTMGEPMAMKLIDALGEAPSNVFEIIAREKIDCEPVRAGTLHLAHAPAGLADLRERFKQGNRYGAPLQLLEADETAQRVGSDVYDGALFDPRAGTIQPRAYCLGLARAAKQAGAQIFEHSQVSTMRHEDGYWLVTANCVTVKARALLMATNAYHADIEGTAAPQFSVVHYSQFATAPLSEDVRQTILANGEGCWDTALVMSSVRMDQAGRLIFGFMGDIEGAAGKIHTAWAHREMARLFPQLRGISFDHAWQGRIAVAADKVPKVLSLGPSAYAIFGYSGRGIAPGTVFGTAAAKALLDESPDAFPIAVGASHVERFTGVKSMYYEFGAALRHLVP